MNSNTIKTRVTFLKKAARSKSSMINFSYTTKDGKTTTKLRARVLGTATTKTGTAARLAVYPGGFRMFPVTGMKNMRMAKAESKTRNSSSRRRTARTAATS